jgi:hypothetical protein
MPDPCTPHLALDIFKSFIGALLGASFAFFFALRKDHLTRVKERKAAANFAMLTLLKQTDDYLNHKTHIQAFRDNLQKEQPASPPWMLIKPMQLDYSPDLRFNLDSLVFLLEYDGGASAIEHLLNADRKYHNFFRLLEVHAEAGEEMQKAFSAAKIDPRKGARISELEDVAGFHLVEKTNSFVRAIFRHFEGRDRVLQDACDELPQLLQKIFGKKGVIGIQLPDQKELRAQAQQAMPKF